MDRLEVARLLNKASLQFRSRQKALAEVLVAENRARASVLQTEIEAGNSVAGAERLAEIHTESLVSERTKIKYELLALEEELNHYRFLVKYGMEGVL